MKTNFVLVHGARHSWDLGYRSEIMTMRTICKKLHYIPVISRPNDELTKWNGEKGYVQDIWNKKDSLFSFRVDPRNSHVLLCGNPGMIDGMVEILSSEGFKEHSKKSPGNIHLERYW